MKFGNPIVRELDLVDYDEIAEEPARPPAPAPPPPAPSSYASWSNIITYVEPIFTEIFVDQDTIIQSGDDDRQDATGNRRHY